MTQGQGKDGIDTFPGLVLFHRISDKGAELCPGRDCGEAKSCEKEIEPGVGHQEQKGRLYRETKDDDLVIPNQE